eukprot:7984788-Pyramimonas_sp.AAC.1
MARMTSPIFYVFLFPVVVVTPMQAKVYRWLHKVTIHPRVGWDVHLSNLHCCVGILRGKRLRY